MEAEQKSSKVSKSTRRGIKTFMDDKELETGTSIFPSLLTAIEESMSSAWCLSELTKIVQCMEDKKTIVFSIFYDVDPSNMRNQKRSFAEAFNRHDERFRQNDEGFHIEMVKEWRAAFTNVANLSGFKVKGCDQIVNAVVPSNLLQRLHNLETLICGDLCKLEYVFITEGLEPEQIVLTTLRQMILSHLWNLIKIWDGPPTLAIFRNLNFLAVYGCHKLKTLFKSDVAQCLLQLEHLWAQSSFGLERVIEPSGETEANKVLVLPKLKGIVLESLPQLTVFYSSTTGSSTIDHIECPSLQHLYVYYCPKFSSSASEFQSKNRVQLSDYEHFISLSERYVAVSNCIR